MARRKQIKPIYLNPSELAVVMAGGDRKYQAKDVFVHAYEDRSVEWHQEQAIHNYVNICNFQASYDCGGNLRGVGFTWIVPREKAAPVAEPN
jgi:hypothetical protein